MASSEKIDSWLGFACVMLIIAGILDVVWGITALTKETFFTKTLLFANLPLWATVFIFIGVLKIIAGAGATKRLQWARWLGVVMSAFSFVWAFMAIWLHPFWAVIIIAVDIMIVYALLQYAEPRSEAESG